MSSSYDPVSSEEEGNSLIDLITNSIELHQSEELTIYMERIPLLTLDPDTSYSLLELFLSTAFDETNSNAAAILIKMWADTNPEEEIRPTIVYLFRMDGFSEEFYQFIMKIYPQLDFSDLMLKLNNYDQEISTIMAANRISKYFGPQNMEIYEELLADIASSQESGINPIVYSYIESLMKDANTANVKAKPTWIIEPPFRIDGVLPTNDQLSEWVNKYVGLVGLDNDNLDNANPEELSHYLVELYQILTGSTDKLSIITHLHPEAITDPTKTENIITDHLSQSNFAEIRQELVEQIRATKESALVSDPFLFRVFGPSYFSQGDRLLDSKAEDPCLRYGGCRESLCWEYDNEDSDGDEIIPDIYETNEFYKLEWFTGICQQCGIRILQKHYARRMPMTEGGWNGCYCSEACLLNNTYNDNDSRIPNIKNTTELLETIGVYDRIWPKIEIKEYKYYPTATPTPLLEPADSASLEMNTGVAFSRTPFGPILSHPESSSSTSSLHATIVAPVELPPSNTYN